MQTPIQHTNVQTMSDMGRSLSLILELHGDKLMYLGTIAAALAVGAATGTLLGPVY